MILSRKTSRKQALLVKTSFLLASTCQHAHQEISGLVGKAHQSHSGLLNACMQDHQALFFKVCHSGWDQWAQHEASTKPKLIDEERIGDESDQILRGIKSEDEDSSASALGNKEADKWADKDNSDAVTKDRTTVMLKNLPQSFTRTRLRSLLDSQGFAAKYDFVYVPTAFGSGQSFG